MMVMLGVGCWRLYAHLQSGERTLFPLVFPGVFLFMAWVLQDLRTVLAGFAVPGGVDPARVAERVKPFVRSVSRRAQVFFTLAVAAFFADMFGLLQLI
jgi:hypothetical protein